MDKKKIIIFVLLLAAAISGLIYFFVLQKKSDNLVASGTIEGVEITLSSRVIGRVQQINIDEGDKVKKGDILIIIEAQELNQAQKSAEAKYAKAQDDYLRSQQLFKDKMISPQEALAAKLNMDIAGAAYETAKLQYENAVIRSPLDATVLIRPIELGELAVIGTPLITLADLLNVDLVVYLAEEDVGKVALGEEVSVTVDSYPGKNFSGKVVHISDQAEFTPKSIQTKAERTTQVFGIKIKIKNSDLLLKPGMPADAEFKWNMQ